MLSLKHLKFIITISILIICIVLIKKNETFFNREEITDDYKTDFITNMLSFGNQPEIYKDEIKMFKMKNSKKIILENISRFTRLNDFRYLKNYSIFNKKLFFQKKPLVNTNTIHSGYILTNPFTGDLKNKRYGFCIQLNNFKDEKRKQTLNNDIRDNLTEFSIVFTNKNFNTDLQKLQDINDITQQTTYQSIPRRTIHLFTKYNAPYEYQPYFKKGDDGEEIRVLGKFQGTNNLQFIKDFPDGKFNILDSNLNPVLTGCSIDIPFCNIHINPFDNIKGRDDIVPGLFSQKDGKYVLINDPKYVEFKEKKKAELIEQGEQIKKPKLQKLMNNPKNFISSRNQFLDLSKITDEEFHDLKNLFEEKHTDLVEKNIDFYKSKGINKIPLDLYKKLQIDNTDLIVKHSLIPETGAENFTNMLFSAHERYQNMDAHFNNKIEKFQDNNLEQYDSEYEGNKYLTYNSFRECRKKENKDEHLYKFVNGEYSIIEDDNPIIKKDKETIEVIRGLSGIKCREYYDKNDKRFYYGGINEDGTPECFGEEGYCKMYDTKEECKLENDNVTEGFQNPESISQKMIKNNCQNFYISHKINNSNNNFNITNNENLDTKNVFFTLHKNYELSFDIKITKNYNNWTKENFIYGERLHKYNAIVFNNKDKSKIKKLFENTTTPIEDSKLSSLWPSRIYGYVYCYFDILNPGYIYFTGFLKYHNNLHRELGALEVHKQFIGYTEPITSLKDKGFFIKIFLEDYLVKHINIRLGLKERQPTISSEEKLLFIPLKDFEKNIIFSFVSILVNNHLDKLKTFFYNTDISITLENINKIKVLINDNHSKYYRLKKTKQKWEGKDRLFTRNIDANFLHKNFKEGGDIQNDENTVNDGVLLQVGKLIIGGNVQRTLFKDITHVDDDIIRLTEEEYKLLKSINIINPLVPNLEYKYPYTSDENEFKKDEWGLFYKYGDPNRIFKGNYIIEPGVEHESKFVINENISEFYISKKTEEPKLICRKPNSKKHRLIDKTSSLGINRTNDIIYSNFNYKKLPDSNEEELNNDRCLNIMNENREIYSSKYTDGVGVEQFTNAERRNLNYNKVDKNFNKINFMDCRYNIKNDALCKHVDNVKVFDYKQQDFKLKTKNLIELITFKECKQKDFISIISNNKNISLSKELKEEINIETNKNNIPFFLQENIKNFALNKPLDYLIEPCAEGYEDIHPGFLFDSLEYKFKINDEKLEIIKNANSLGYIVDNQNSPYILSSGDNIVLYISKDNKLNVQIVNEGGSRSALKKLNIQNKFGDEMNLMLRSNNTNIFQNIYHMEQQGNITYPYNPFIEISK